MYKYFNPHPKGLLTNDCVKRAIVVATGMDYLKVQRELNEYKAVTGSKKFNSIKNLRYVEAVLNAKKTTFQEELTAEEFCKNYPRGRFILDMNEHWSACVDGCIYDTWNCGKEKVNFAYEIATVPYQPPNLKNQVFKYCCILEKISARETRIRIYDGNGAFAERIIPRELSEGYVLCLQHSNYQYIDLEGGKRYES